VEAGRTRTTAKGHATTRNRTTAGPPPRLLTYRPWRGPEEIAAVLAKAVERSGADRKDKNTVLAALVVDPRIVRGFALLTSVATLPPGPEEGT
jgi:hypothetical protein